MIGKWFYTGLFLFPALLFAQTKAAVENPNKVMRKGLVVGIVVDQMRHDYLYKFWDKYSEGGFRRLVKGGYVFANTNYDYIPTNTAPGHACIYTGTGPAQNGIINNEWYDRQLNKTIYCVGDSTVKAVGTTSISGKMSPRNLLSTTVTDALRLATNMKAKVIAIALKDRGAILPAGQSGNAAYWHDPHLNNWVTSSYYMSELPEWVAQFNSRKLVDSLLSRKWETLLPIDQYIESTSDNNQYEGLFDGETKPVFPHDLPALKKEESELIRSTPFGNTFTKEFAIAAMKGEKLSKNNVTDFLAISFSSTDYVGHKFGINSIELEDTYLRLDKDIAELLKFLDEWTGNNYLLFLTSDHGAVVNPLFADDHKLKGGNMSSGGFKDSLKEHLKNFYGLDNLISSSSAHNVFLNRPLIESKKLDLIEVQERCAAFIRKQEGVSVVLTAAELEKGLSRNGIYSFMQNGFHVQRSSDVSVLLQPGWISWYTKTGTTHGGPYSYDTHVPLIFFGKNIRQGFSVDQISVCDIAPTISSLLNIEFPSAHTGKPIMSLFE